MMTITLTPEVEEALCREAARQNKPAEQIANEVLARSLGLPRKPLPPGKTLKDVFDEFHRTYPNNETDEEAHRALEALS